MGRESTHVDIEFIQGLEWNSLEKAGAQNKRNLIVLDDLFDEASQSKKLLAIVITARHCNFHLMDLRHILFQQKKLEINRPECRADNSLQ